VTVEFRRRLAQGDRGAVVSEVQRILAVKKLWDGPVDGRYGSMLARAVRQFQSVSGLKVHGEVDLITWKELVK
jgi:peptidoglycan hydrolase-like protein with peptidoglycan-binding domain